MRKKLERTLGVVAVVAVGLAVTDGGAAHGTAQPSLTGQTWELVKLGPLNQKGVGITARFTTDGTVSGFSGCNSYSGTYTASGSSLTISKKLAVTQKACRDLVMAQERAYLAMLTRVRRYSISGGTLMLKGRFGAVALATFAVQSQSLAGEWLVTGYNNGRGAVVSVMAATKLTATFSAKLDQVSGLAGCNSYSGDVKVAAPKLTVGPLASTKKECSSPAGVMQQEAEFLSALGTAATFQLQGSMLELRTAGNALAVTMERVSR